ncbi:hydrogenase expression/formation protein HypE [Alteromonas lipolytica]|uniref:Hydrogenase expression/formation protein HypE n=1 Tax=Alteromonas lipolytica TaxID=1856405 RepID=A0A1E8FDZ0_9ALTE|nr:hydrogenase expression/formation protein HypE [Alteromonas lipolytica]OFI34142.1 hydrogenase expression/formation protein HypE [Alteromonas lipolytica]GGF65031.1 hydrogenase expression/formation protein HypE [Alteromonas lipolytica]
MNKPQRTLRATTITMAHGAGGKAMRDLIEDVFVGTFANPDLAQLEDQARFDLAELMQSGARLAFTTDSYVVDPVEFPGGDIGSLAVNGTVNDIAVSGAIPKYLSCGMILEEGLDVALLRRVVTSMKEAADKAGVTIVTGDTKVVPKGKGDKIFINTSGIGVIPEGVDISASNCRVGDKIIVNGLIGDHGAAILNARGDLALDVELETDCQALNELVQTMLKVCPQVHAIRDASRGGVATVLCEFAESSGVSIRLQEEQIPVRETVRGVCEILGLDALYFANEGKLVASVPADSADAVLDAMRAHPAGKDAAIIGEVIESKYNRVLVKTHFGGERILDMLVGEQLPRIC